MKVDLQKLKEGLSNSIFVKEQVEQVAAYRINLCNTCPYYSPNMKKAGKTFVRLDKFCGLCGCNMYLKTRALSAHCPLGDPDKSIYPGESKWGAVIADEKLSESLLELPGIKEDIITYKIQLSQNKVDEHGND
jgi:hypothetical protein